MGVKVVNPSRMSEPFSVARAKKLVNSVALRSMFIAGFAYNQMGRLARICSAGAAPDFLFCKQKQHASWLAEAAPPRTQLTSPQ